MKRTIVWLFLGILAAIAAYFFGGQGASVPTSKENVGSIEQQTDQEAVGMNKDRTDAVDTDQVTMLVPLERARERVTKKPFGIFITPKTSPVQPERFSGYHIGTDFEIFSEESGAEVVVRAICDGTLLSKLMASGYGGVLVQSCQLAGEDVTIIYGHLALSSVSIPVGGKIAFGDKLGSLGAAKSEDTDGERKHLHLGIHRGKNIDILGYVPRKEQLAGWLDPCIFVCL